MFHRDSFKIAGIDPCTLWPHVKDRPDPVTKFSGAPPQKTRNIKILSLNGASATVDDFVSEEEEDLADALSDKNDMLKISKSWWILEVLPQKIKFQKDDDSWATKLSCVSLSCLLSIYLTVGSINLGRGRVIPKQRLEGVKIHHTVKMRMDLKEEDGKPYSPKAKWLLSVQPEWID